MKTFLSWLAAMARAPARIVSWKRRLSAALHEWIEDTVEALPDTIADFSEGFGAGRVETLERRRERLLRRFVHRDRMMFGRWSPYRVYGMLSLARFYREQFQYGQAESWYLRSLAVLERSREPGHPQLSETYSLVGEFLLAYRQPERAARVLERAVQSKVIQHGEGSVELLADLRLLGRALLESGDIDGAISAHLRDIAIIEASRGIVSEELLSRLDALRSICKDAERPAELSRVAKKYEHLTNLLIMEKALGDEHASLVNDLEPLAAIYQLEGKSDISTALRERIKLVRLANKVRGGDYPRLPSDMEDLADLYDKRGKGGDGTVAHRLRMKARLIREDRADRNKRAGISAWR